MTFICNIHIQYEWSISSGHSYISMKYRLMFIKVLVCKSICTLKMFNDISSMKGVRDILRVENHIRVNHTPNTKQNVHEQNLFNNVMSTRNVWTFELIKLFIYLLSQIIQIMYTVMALTVLRNKMPLHKYSHMQHQLP